MNAHVITHDGKIIAVALGEEESAQKEMDKLSKAAFDEHYKLCEGRLSDTSYQNYLNHHYWKITTVTATIYV